MTLAVNCAGKKWYEGGFVAGVVVSIAVIACVGMALVSGQK